MNIVGYTKPMISKVLLLGLGGLLGCGSNPIIYGDTVSFESLKEEAVTLAEARSSEGPVTVTGEIGRVCDMGCWFYLMGESDMVYVKLDLAVGLVIPTDSEGKQVLALGEFQGEGSSAEFRASTLALY